MKFVDLFAGAGGLSEGFIRAGYDPVAHIEMDLAACLSLKTRVAYHHLKSTSKIKIYNKYLLGEITRDELYKKVPQEKLNCVLNYAINAGNNKQIHSLIQKNLRKQQVDLIVGGPPCQAYSLVGRARSANGMEGDSRNFLYVEYANYLRKYRPRMFIFENVVGLKSANRGQYLLEMEKLFLKSGYKMQLFTVDASNFGVLQKRKRVIIVGWQTGLSLDPPDLENQRADDFKQFSVRDIFSDLPSLSAGGGKDKFLDYSEKGSKYLEFASLRKNQRILTQHVARPHTDQDKKIYALAVKKWDNENLRLNYNDLPDSLKSHSNRSSFFDRFKVVAADLNFSHTVVAHIAKDGHYYIHPDKQQNRSITVREAARLQSFPDDYYFEGVKEGQNRTAAFKQIGNAVPPLMAEKIAVVIRKILEQ
jgi:DNA (cytosine-5)-methyltransferase 1